MLPSLTNQLIIIYRDERPPRLADQSFVSCVIMWPSLPNQLQGRETTHTLTDQYFVICVIMWPLFTNHRDERPPRLSGPGSNANNANGRWIPPSSVKRDVQQNPDDTKYDKTFRKVRG